MVIILSEKKQKSLKEKLLIPKLPLNPSHSQYVWEKSFNLGRGSKCIW